MAIPKAWRKDWRRLEWASRNWRTIELYVVQRLVQEYADEIGSSGRLLHLIKVLVGSDVYYGVSLEPEPYEARLSDIGEKLLIASSSGLSAVHDDLVAASPWVPSNVPAVFSRPDDGYFFVRGTTAEEMELVAILNDRKNQDLGLRPVDPSTRTWFVDDLRFNMLRGEFGIGDEGRPIWRPALRRLVRDRLPYIQQEVEEAMFKANLNLNAPAFEPRSQEWLAANEDFAMMIIKSTAV